MARQIQIRRGTAEEHEQFTGAIGEITMDTTNNTLRVHDGETLGGTVLAKLSDIPERSNADYVIECQNPSADNNYTWYRKYKSGWIEQGGHTATNGGNATRITLPIAMASDQYDIQIQGTTRNNGSDNAQWQVMPVITTTYPKTQTSFYVQGSITGYNLGFAWRVSGIVL